MRFTKPLWLRHSGEKKDAEVYTAHVSPDGSRLATGAGDGHVRIWSTAAILAASNPAYTAPKQLASLSYHSGTVHSVRFSGNGKYLASGADDKILCVYNLDPSPPSHTTFGSKELPPVENWRIFRRLIGHENDVQDLGWSCDSSILVSVGLDSKVVIWSGTTFEKLKTLSSHQSHVKGITFDPANKYFATASDDRTIKIYRFTSPPPNASAYDQTNNFTLEHTVTAPFSASPLSTYFRRCSWSPEGAHIAAANAVNGPVSSVAIINRGSWDSEINLIGHEGPVEVCAFSPRLFLREPPIEPTALVPKPVQQSAAVSVVACAGQDKTLSVWNTSFPRPFVTTAELCSRPISDLAWSPDGETIYVTSLDGTIAAVVFERGEMGYPASEGANVDALAKYGAGRRMGVVEGAEGLRLEEVGKAEEGRRVEGRMGELMGAATEEVAAVEGAGALVVAPAEPEPVAPILPPKDPQQERIDKLKQRVTITKDGKKRLTPLLLSGSNANSESNLPRTQLQASMRVNGTSSHDDSPAGRILDLSRPYDGLPKGGLASLVMGGKRKYAVDGDPNDEDEGKRVEKRIRAIEATGAIPIVQPTPEGLVPATSNGTTTEVPAALRPAILDPALTGGGIRLAIPQIRTSILRPLDLSLKAADAETQTRSSHTDTTASAGEDTLILSALNASQPRNPTRITLSRRQHVLWQDFLPHAVLLTTGTRAFWAAGCEDGTLYLWTPAGRRMCAGIVLEAQPVIMDARGKWLLVVTASGGVHVWDVRRMRRREGGVLSLGPVLEVAARGGREGGMLTPGPAVMLARLNSEGTVVVGLSNGEGFAWDAGMGTWMRVSESWWAVGSQYWGTNSTAPAASTSTPTPQPKKSQDGDEEDNDESIWTEGLHLENVSAGLIPFLERHTTAQALLKGKAVFLQRLVRSLLSTSGYEGFESAVSIAHLETRLAAARMLGAREEWRGVLGLYVKRLGAEAARGKIEEVLAGLVREGEGGEGGQGGEGFGGLEVAREMVVVLGRYREVQRVVLPYARVLGVLDAGAGVGGGDEEMV